MTTMEWVIEDLQRITVVLPDGGKVFLSKTTKGSWRSDMLRSPMLEQACVVSQEHELLVYTDLPRAQAFNPPLLPLPEA